MAKFKEDRYAEIERWRGQITALLEQYGCSDVIVAPGDLGCKILILAKTNLPTYSDEEWAALEKA